MKKLKEIWKNKFKILKAFYAYIKGDKRTVDMSQERLKICQSNICGYYDAFGTSDNAVVKGNAACGICGCNLKIMSSLAEAECSLSSIGSNPLWEAKTN